MTAGKESSEASSSGDRGRKAAYVVVALLVVLLVVALTRGAGDNRGDERPFFEARKGPLTISVAEAGTLKARENVIIKSQVSGQATIIYLVEEGTPVKAGELLVELDTSSLEDRRVEQQIKVQNSETAFIRARENLEVVKSQAASDDAQATLEHQFAKEDLTQYREGEYPKQLKEADAQITLQQQELENATEKLTWSEQLHKEQYISQSELETDRLSKNRAELDYELALTSRDLLKDYTNQRRLAELNSNIEQTARALDRVKLKGSSDVIQAEADLRNKQAEHRQQQAKLAMLEEQLVRAKIHAPVDGMVVYATSTRASWRGNDEPLDEGQSVRERQELIHLPKAGAVVAEIKVHESNLDKIAVGQSVRVTVDALPGAVLAGKVSKIAPLADASSRWMNPDLKVYRTEIDLVEALDELRTGMSCRAEIIVADYQDAIYVPVQCVVRRGDDTVVYVEDGDEAAPRVVELGLDNNQMACILNGVTEGERVLLNPPLQESGTDSNIGRREGPVANGAPSDRPQGTAGRSGGPPRGAQAGSRASGPGSSGAKQRGERRRDGGGSGGRGDRQRRSGGTGGGQRPGSNR
ncbi:MAG: efflux RND transporter periplasmic adaptor subunit [Planctomycetota bacterium]